MCRHGVVALMGGFLLPLVMADCSRSDKWNITRPSQVSELADCPTYTGDVEISQMTGTIDLSGVETILGDLSYLLSINETTATEAALRSSTLRNVSGILAVKNTDASEFGESSDLFVSLPLLEFVDEVDLEWGQGSLDLYMGPGVSIQEWLIIRGTHNAMRLRDGGLHLDLSTAGSVVLEDIDFSPVDGDNATLSFAVQEAFSMNILNCRGLEAIELDSLERLESYIMIADNKDLDRIFSSVSEMGAISVWDNGRNAEVSLPNLVTLGGSGDEDTGSTIINHLFKLEMPKLKAVLTGFLQFSANQFTDLSLPRLETTWTLDLFENPLLENLWIPRLNAISDLIVLDNPSLLNVTANLLRLAQSVDMRGNFTNIEFFNLETVTGDFSVVGHESMDCSWFDEHFKGRVVQGEYSCVGNHTKPAVERKPSTPTSLAELEEWEAGQGGGGDGNEDAKEDADAPGPGLSTGAKAGIGVGVSLGVLACAAGAFLLFRRRKNAKAAGDQDQSTKGEVPPPYPQELLVEDKPVEIGAGLATELPAEVPSRPSTPPAELGPEEVKRPSESGRPGDPARPSASARPEDLVSPL